jgi:hypothetical protein
MDGTIRINGSIELTVTGTGDESAEGDGSIERYEFDQTFPLGDGPSISLLGELMSQLGVEPTILPVEANDTGGSPSTARRPGQDFSDYEMDEAR